MSITTIPGRRISSGESFLTDWISRGGDCMLLRAELIVEGGGGSASVAIQVETREEPGTTVSSNVPPTVPSSGSMTLSSPGVVTGAWMAGTLEGQVRVNIACTGGTAGETYAVVRLFPPVFFDHTGD